MLLGHRVSVSLVGFQPRHEEEDDHDDDESFPRRNNNVRQRYGVVPPRPSMSCEMSHNFAG